MDATPLSASFKRSRSMILDMRLYFRNKGFTSTMLFNCNTIHASRESDEAFADVNHRLNEHLQGTLDDFLLAPILDELVVACGKMFA